MIRSRPGRALRAIAVVSALSALAAVGVAPASGDATVPSAQVCDDPYAGDVAKYTFRSLPAPGRTVQPGGRIVYWMTVEFCRPVPGVSMHLLAQDIVDVVSIKPAGFYSPDWGTGEPDDPLEPFGLVVIDWAGAHEANTGFRGNLTIRIPWGTQPGTVIETRMGGSLDAPGARVINHVVGNRG